MKEYKVEFKVAMDNEAKKSGEIETVKFILEVDKEKDLDGLVKDAIAHSVVKWQGQIRSNWDKFLENGVPEKVRYGQTLFGGGRRVTVRPPTEEEVASFMAAQIGRLTPAGITVLASTGRLPDENAEGMWK